MVRTRFAPSPTGFLHVGGLRTALYSYLFAKRHGGQFLLRIEDTDRERFVEGGMENFVSSMAWAGIMPDEGVMMDSHNLLIQKGEKGPYIQSERLPIYAEHISVLLEKGHAYHCFCTKERLLELRAIQEANKLPTGYDGHCRSLTRDEVRERIEANIPHVIRMRMPKEGVTAFTDLVRGRVEFQNTLIDDQVLIKSDGFPTYHFAVVVDDHLMEITHVIRAEEWLSSTPKHLVLYDMFGWEPPQFAHLSLLINENKQKLSKRHGDVSVQDFKEHGYLPESLVNFIAFLGWNPGDERELFSLSELEQAFSFDHVSRAAAVFNRDKLAWYNEQYIRRMDDETLLERAAPFLINAGLVTLADLENETTRHWLMGALALEKERATTLTDFPEHIAFLFPSVLEYEPDLLVWKKSTAADARNMLAALYTELSLMQAVDWHKASIESHTLAWIANQGYGVGDVLWPARVALSGKKNSPGPFDIMAVLGKEKTLDRLGHALAKLA